MEFDLTLQGRPTLCGCTSSCRQLLYVSQLPLPVDAMPASCAWWTYCSSLSTQTALVVQAAESELIKNKGVVINVSSGVALAAAPAAAMAPYFIAKASQVRRSV
jgi:NAD(P)-dependent dehydrogenase (short-subunit alcohol dehydrogenase family)